MVEDPDVSALRLPVFYCTWLLSPAHPVEMCRAVSEAGFDGASFSLNCRHGSARLDRLSEQDASDLRETFLRLGLDRSIHVETWSFLRGEDNAAEVAEWKSAVEGSIAALTDRRLLALNVSMDPPYQRGTDRQFLSGTAHELLAFLVGLRERYDIRPAMENWPYPPTGTPEAMARVLAPFGGAVGMLFDVGHAHLALTREWCPHHSMAEFTAALPVPVVEVHLHDNHGEKDDHLMPGEGDADLPTAFGALRQRGYAGPVTIECNLDAEGRPGRLQALRAIRSAYNI